MAWDRINFGRVLRDLRSQAGLTQEQLGERIGKDRRRIIILEQGTAVREPRLGEIALMAVAVGLPEAEQKLRAAVHANSPAVQEPAGTIRDGIRAEVAGKFSELLARLDETNQLARELARSSDDVLSESHITVGELQRSSRPIKKASLAIRDELVKQAQRLLRDLGPVRSLVSQVVGKSDSTPLEEFQQRQLRYWRRCDLGGGRQMLNLDEKPDAMDEHLDVLELGVFHLHPTVSRLATTAIQCFGHLFLVWGGLAFEAGQRGFYNPAKLSKDVYEEKVRAEETRLHTGRSRLEHALKLWASKSPSEFAEALLKQEWAAAEKENLEAFARLWNELGLAEEDVQADAVLAMFAEMPKTARKSASDEAVEE